MNDCYSRFCQAKDKTIFVAEVILAIAKYSIDSLEYFS